MAHAVLGVCAETGVGEGEVSDSEVGLFVLWLPVL